ncbi:MAG TPA: DUF4266 domain-containing protein [Polyangiaceae bacterium]|nr:DUF4266 domain-containing protein [Polyangiaceae bacterium]
MSTFETHGQKYPMMEARRRQPSITQRPAGRFASWLPVAQRCAAVVALAACLLLAFGCVTVRPEQRAILADPVMQLQGDPREAAQRQHVLENREGSFGGSSVQGGGCGCN